MESRTAGTHKGKASYDAVFDDAEGAGVCLLEIRFPAKKIYGLLKDTWRFTLNPPSLAQPICRVRPIDPACLCVPVVYVLACLESMCMMPWGPVHWNSYEFIGRLSV